MRVAPDPLPPRPPAEIRAAAEHNITVSLTPAETLGIFAELDRVHAELESRGAAIERVRELCESRRAATTEGGRTDVDMVWPNEILDALDGE